MDELMKIDLYELLNISTAAEEKEIKKAYRKKALSCHPDKNPDNPKAAELFQQLSKALEVLTDAAAKAAYDKILHARKAARVRHTELDSKRKKLKEDLESKEKAAEDIVQQRKDAAEKLQKEIERLRKDGSRQLEEQLELMRQQVEKDRNGPDLNSQEVINPRLKIKWKCQKNDETNGGYNKENLESIFNKYGHATCLLSTKKKGSAIVEFSDAAAAQCAFEKELGDETNPFTLSWLSGQPEGGPKAPRGPAPAPSKDSPLTSRDYESLVLMKLRQAEERKKLIQQMMESEDD